MKLELLHAAASGPEKPVKLLFVHGICTGAWVWQWSFMPFFASLGYDCHALSLRGHGESEGKSRVRDFTLSDFAEDIGWALGEIGGPVAIIAHSFGGGVAQHFVQRGGKPSGTVLLCSAPPHGLMRAAAAMYATNPKLASEMKGVLHNGLSGANLDVIERGLFAGDPPPEIRQRFEQNICDIAEAGSRQLAGWLPFAPFPWGMGKLFVVGCEKDQFVPVADVRLTAIYYGARSAIIPNGAHAIMLDRNWHDAAQPIADWLDKTFKA